MYDLNSYRCDISKYHGDYVDRIHRFEPEVKDNNDTARSASYRDVHLDSANNPKLYDKRDYCNFPIGSVPFI